MPRQPAAVTFGNHAQPRLGLAVRVAWIRPQRYSAVMNIVATTITAISPPNAPSRVRPMGNRPRRLLRARPPRCHRTPSP
jgi:hypothetical protein